MTTRERVRVKTGVPVASDFASPLGTPLVIDDTAVTGTAYFLDANGVIAALARYVGTAAWTPTDASGASLTFTSKEGSYVRLGSLVVAWAAVSYPVTASGAACSIGGLPFTVRNSASAQGGMVTYSTETTAARALPFANTTTIDIRDTAGNILTNATLSTDTVYACVIYTV